MKYLISETTKEERVKLINLAYGISASGAGKPSEKTMQLLQLYIDGVLELEDVKKLIIKEYQENEG